MATPLNTPIFQLNKTLQLTQALYSSSISFLHAIPSPWRPLSSIRDLLNASMFGPSSNVFSWDAISPACTLTELSHSQLCTPLVLSRLLKGDPRRRLREPLISALPFPMTHPLDSRHHSLARLPIHFSAQGNFQILPSFPLPSLGLEILHAGRWGSQRAYSPVCFSSLGTTALPYLILKSWKLLFHVFDPFLLLFQAVEETQHLAVPPEWRQHSVSESPECKDPFQLLLEGSSPMSWIQLTVAKIQIPGMSRLTLQREQN